MDSSPSEPVLQVVLQLCPGGTERLVIELCKRLPAAFAPMVCCLDAPGLWARELAPHGVDVATLGRLPGFRPELGWRLARLARRRGARVLHCHQYTPYVYGVIAARLAPELRVVFTEHGRLSDAPPSRKRRLANLAITRHPAQLFAVSQDLRRHMIEEGFPPDRLGVQYNGTQVGPTPDAAARARARALLGLPEDAPVIGTVARLDPVKDLGALIAAFSAQEATRGARLVVVGDGPEGPALRRAAASGGAAERIHFAGHREDVRELLPAFDVYANCSRSEGVSLTILEAMAAALPVVATAVGGTPEVVIEGETGWLTPARDERALGAALAAALIDPEQARRRGEAGRRRVVERFALEDMVGAYAAAYHTALGARRS